MPKGVFFFFFFFFYFGALHNHLFFFGLLRAGLLPFNLYRTQYITNEMLVMLLACASVYYSLRIFVNPEVSLKQYAILGVLLGAALLAKTSAISLLPLSVIAVVWNAYGKGIRNPGRLFSLAGIKMLCCVAVCGWHYVRLTSHFGRPFV